MKTGKGSEMGKCNNHLEETETRVIVDAEMAAARARDTTLPCWAGFTYHAILLLAPSLYRKCWTHRLLITCRCQLQLATLS